MTPKEKATQLINLYIPFVDYWDYYEDKSRDEKLVLNDAKSLATITVNEIIMSDELKNYVSHTAYWNKMNYLNEVKDEIARF